MSDGVKHISSSSDVVEANKHVGSLFSSSSDVVEIPHPRLFSSSSDVVPVPQVTQKARPKLTDEQKQRRNERNLTKSCNKKGDDYEITVNPLTQTRFCARKCANSDRAFTVKNTPTCESDELAKREKENTIADEKRRREEAKRQQAEARLRKEAEDRVEKHRREEERKRQAEEKQQKEAEEKMRREEAKRQQAEARLQKEAEDRADKQRREEERKRQAEEKQQKEAEEKMRREEERKRLAEVRLQKEAEKNAEKERRHQEREAVKLKKREDDEKEEEERLIKQGQKRIAAALQTVTKTAKGKMTQDLTSKVKTQIDMCDQRIDVVDSATLADPEKFKQHFFPDYTFDPASSKVSASCRGEDSVLNNNQLSVYIMSRCRALNKTVAPGLLVNHGTGSGKTLIGVLIMLAFWNTVHSADPTRAWCVMSVSTRKNQIVDNSSEVLAKLIVKYFQFYPIRIYGTKPDLTIHEEAKPMFSFESYLHQLGVTADQYKAYVKDLSGDKSHIPPMVLKYDEHWKWVEKLIIDRVYKGIYDSLVYNPKDDHGLSEAATAQLEKFTRNREKSGMILFTNSKFGRDFAANLWESDSDMFNMKRLAKKEATAPNADNSNDWVKEPMEQFVDDLTKDITKHLKQNVDDYLKRIQGMLAKDELNAPSSKDSKAFKNLKKSLAENLGAKIEVNGAKIAGTDIVTGPAEIKIHEYFNYFLMKKFNIKEVTVGRGRQATKTFEKVNEEFEEEAVEEGDGDVEAEAAETESAVDDDTLQAETDIPYFILNEKRQMENCVFILDEMQLLFQPPAEEVRESINYERTLCAFMHYRNPQNTYIAGLTATPGFNEQDVRSVITLIQGDPDVFLDTKTTKLLRALEKTQHTANITDRTAITYNVRVPGVVSWKGEKVQYLDDPVVVAGAETVRVRPSRGHSIGELVDSISSMRSLVSVVDYSADRQFYPNLRFNVRCVKLNEEYEGDVSERSDELKEKAHKALANEEADKADVKALRELHANVPIYKLGNMYSLKPFDDAMVVLGPSSSFKRRLRIDLLYLKKGEDARGGDRPTRERKQVERFADFQAQNAEAEIVDTSKFGCPAYMTSTSNGSIKTIYPSTKLTTLVDALLDGVIKRNGKHYVYCSDPYALFVIAHYLRTITHQVTTMDSVDATQKKKRVSLNDVPNPNPKYPSDQPRLKPYTGESLETLLNDRKQNVLRFFYLNGRTTKLSPYQTVIPSERVSDTRRGFNIACGKNSYQNIDKLRPTNIPEGKDYSMYGVDVKSKVNLSGDLIPIILATGEAYKGVDMKGINHIHLLDPFVDINDCIQLMGRGPRMCSHADFASPSQRTVMMHIYMAVSGSESEGDETVDWEVYKKSKTQFMQVWKPINTAFRQVAYDREVFGELVKTAEARVDTLLNLACTTVDNLAITYKPSTKSTYELDDARLAEISEQLHVVVEKISKSVERTLKKPNVYTVTVHRGDAGYARIDVQGGDTFSFQLKSITHEVGAKLGTLIQLLNDKHYQPANDELDSAIQKTKKELTEVARNTQSKISAATKIANEAAKEAEKVAREAKEAEKKATRKKNALAKIRGFTTKFHEDIAKESPKEPVIQEPVIQEPVIQEPVMTKKQAAQSKLRRFTQLFHADISKKAPLRRSKKSPSKKSPLRRSKKSPLRRSKKVSPLHRSPLHEEMKKVSPLHRSPLHEEMKKVSSSYRSPLRGETTGVSSYRSPLRGETTEVSPLHRSPLHEEMKKVSPLPRTSTEKSPRALGREPDSMSPRTRRNSPTDQWKHTTSEMKKLAEEARKTRLAAAEMLRAYDDTRRNG